MSSNACVGCWSLPEPAFMIGIGRSLLDSSHAICSASPFSGVRMMIMSKYDEKVRMESSRDSPLNSLEVAASRTLPHVRPRIWHAARWLRNVRELGWEK